MSLLHTARCTSRNTQPMTELTIQIRALFTVFRRLQLSPLLSLSLFGFEFDNKPAVNTTMNVAVNSAFLPKLACAVTLQLSLYLRAPKLVTWERISIARSYLTKQMREAISFLFTEKLINYIHLFRPWAQDCSTVMHLYLELVQDLAPGRVHQAPSRQSGMASESFVILSGSITHKDTPGVGEHHVPIPSVSPSSCFELCATLNSLQHR